MLTDLESQKQAMELVLRRAELAAWYVEWLVAIGIVGGLIVAFIILRNNPKLRDVQRQIDEEKDRIARIESSQLNLKIAEANRQAEEAKERSAVSNQRAAEADERAAVANQRAAELEFKSNPWQISDEERIRMREVLLPFKYQQHFVCFGIPDDKESTGFSVRLSHALQNCGWFEDSYIKFGGLEHPILRGMKAILTNPTDIGNKQIQNAVTALSSIPIGQCGVSQQQATWVPKSVIAIHVGGKPELTFESFAASGKSPYSNEQIGNLVVELKRHAGQPIILQVPYDDPNPTTWAAAMGLFIFRPAQWKLVAFPPVQAGYPVDFDNAMVLINPSDDKTQTGPVAWELAKALAKNGLSTEALPFDPSVPPGTVVVRFGRMPKATPGSQSSAPKLLP
ncbi:MAG: hypothetical protein ABSD28_02510 [Tepidisphaeraceae bacterium]